MGFLEFFQFFKLIRLHIKSFCLDKMRNKLRESCAATAGQHLCLCSQDDLSIFKINFFENILNIRYERKLSQISQKYVKYIFTSLSSKSILRKLLYQTIARRAQV